ncbi:hypothetical protein HMPREF3216_00678 [Gardnerella vaginalis]|uniref:Uncharacterized protein n=1 Tax=Gardnerella vaginalis TaxID=2702 RepID=A0A133NPF0_GARVA|nr:hypothetical protein HMPREF3216_00678 [Gardnerella vaginalis]
MYKIWPKSRTKSGKVDALCTTFDPNHVQTRERLEHFVPEHASVETKCSTHFVLSAAACLLVQSA